MPYSKTPLNLLVAASLLTLSTTAPANVSHHLSSTVITEHPDASEGELILFSTIEDVPHSFSTSETVDYCIKLQDSKLDRFSFLSSESTPLSFDGPFSLNISVNDTPEVVGLDLYDQNKTLFTEDFYLSVYSLNTRINNDSQWKTTSALSLGQTTLTTPQLPKRLQLSAITENDLAETTSTVALALYDESSFVYEGELSLSGVNLINDQWQLARALSLENSRFDFKSTGHSNIVGDIVVGSGSEVRVILSHPSDRFIGNLLSSESFDDNDKTNIFLSLSNGATWNPTYNNDFQTFEWKKNGILDLSLSEGHLRLGTHQSHQATTLIEDGAVLKVRITDEHLNTGIENGKELYLINVEKAQTLGSQNVQITVQVIDERTNKEKNDSLNIHLIHFDDLIGDITLKSDSIEYETGLGKYQTISEFGSGFSGGYVINDIRTDLIAPSTLANNFVDTVSSQILSVERVGLTQQSFLIERIPQNHNRGLWVNQNLGKVNIKYGDGTRAHSLNSQTTSIGYDLNLSLPYLQEAFAGTLFYFNQNDVEFNGGQANIDNFGAGFYLGGLSEQSHYRILLLAQYGQTKSDLFSPAFIINGVPQETLQLNNKTDHFGASLYLGFVSSPETSNPWFFEPFVSAHTYWLKAHQSNESKSIQFSTEQSHQSVVKLGLLTAYRGFKNPISNIYAQLTWIHRFGKNTAIVGKEQNLEQAFLSEELQESWAEWSLSGSLALSKNCSAQLMASGGYAQTVKPRYTMSATFAYRFE